MSLEPDLLIVGGSVHTMLERGAPGSGLAVAGGRVVAFGDEAELRRLATRRTRVLDVDGAAVLPGFNDGHNHMLETGINLTRLQLHSCRSLGEILGRVRERARELPAGTWIVASARWHEERLREARLPVRQELDRAAPHHPVLLPRGGHVAVANTLALQAAGADILAADPPGGRFGRDSRGVLDGVLYERAAIDPVLSRVPTSTDEQRREALRMGVRRYLAEGITSVRDPGLGPDEVAVYVSLRDRHELQVRSNLLLHVPPNSAPDGIRALVEAAAIPFDPWLRVGGLKLFLDGGIEAAALREPHRDRPGDYGELLWRDTALVGALHWAARAGTAAALHVVGDAALEQALRVLERVARSIALEPLRWSLEHVMLADADAVARIRRLGLHVCMQPPLRYELAPAMVRNWGETRASKSCPARAIHDAGIPLVGGSDSDVAGYRPMEAITWSVTGETALGKPSVHEQGLDRWTAIWSYTVAGASLSREEQYKGKLAPGHVADFVVLSDDPFTTTQPLDKLEVQLTYVDGECVYDASAAGSVPGSGGESAAQCAT